MTKSQKFSLYDHPSQMEPLLPSELRLEPALERAHELIRKADRLSGASLAGALPGLRQLLRAMNSYYSNRIEGQHTLPLEIEQALRADYAQDADKARRQRLALAHMATEAQLETMGPQWTAQQDTSCAAEVPVVKRPAKRPSRNLIRLCFIAAHETWPWLCAISACTSSLPHLGRYVSMERRGDCGRMTT